MAVSASDHASVEGFHRLATEAGYRANGLPGERTIYTRATTEPSVLDHDAHKVEVVNHDRG